MNLEEHYNILYSESIAKIKSDSYETDDLIDSSNDQRFGITLVIRPDDFVKNNIGRFLSDIKLIDPGQYYYPNTDLHITVMSIISCYSGFDIKKINIEEYICVIQKCVAGVNMFNVQFKGITASPSCIMAQGFIEDETLNTLRQNLRFSFKNTQLEQSLDKRYEIQTAHSTILRFKEKLKNKDVFLETIEKYRDYNFGTTKIEFIDLVFNDWYQREKHVRTLHRFHLR